MTANDEITTLGRGGSDLTAVALAQALKAKVCEIYTDVDGIYTTDPRIVKEARKIKNITFEEMLEMASLGAQVMQARSIEVAKRFNIPLHVRSSFSKEEGTMITKENEKLEAIAVRGITCNKNEAKITICSVPDKPGIAAKIFEEISKQGINVDTIVQNVPHDKLSDISFTVPKGDFNKAIKATTAIGNKIGAGEILEDRNIARVSLVGSGMRSHSGIAAKMFSTLADNHINIEMISTSEISVSCIITQDSADKAVKALHKALNWSKSKGFICHKIIIYDTTLRDGSQTEGVSYTVNDKVKITHKLDELGVHYIEGGWPGSNPKDKEFFEMMKTQKLKNSRLAAFGSTRRANIKPEDDANLKGIDSQPNTDGDDFRQKLGLACH